MNNITDNEAIIMSSFPEATGDNQAPRYFQDYVYGSPSANSHTFWGRCKAAISDFLCFCAGADPQILRYCPHSERVKEQGIGGVVLATATLAFFSGSYGFYTVFSSKNGFALSAEQQAFDWAALALAILFGLVWSLMIFNLDRFIVSTGGHGDGTEKITLGEIWRAVPRIIMAIVIGLVLSKPLETRIMKTEIEARLTEMQKDEAAKLQRQDDAEYEKGRKELDAKKAERVKQRDQKATELRGMLDRITEQRDRVDKEADGTASGRAGEGKAFNAKKTNLEEMKAQYERTKRDYDPEIRNLDTETAAIQAQIDEGLKKRESTFRENEKKAASLDGLIKRIEIAGEISPGGSLMLTLLLIVLEIAPIFFKMMVAIGPYDYLSENVKRLAIAARGIEIREQINGKGSVEVSDAIYYQAETLYEHEAGKLEVERRLAEVAYGVYQEQLADDIRANPEKYQRSARAPGSMAA
ncbi:DUF4407 domain-containing protein [Noviherbaspirillum pedocola]|uniref:DUF4407 domain-containing protein n=1 Tax=Noviherbaspirillum pedocola TaxID=2801341 RepID=A0A934W6L1_9BURK|nr:DUF4407 domain-containing protein [Noviherbaspirillum pedocola]MBK4735250.1 DUF4407 domain-containing protein [Noviherbaspirillum pedocola]